MMSLCFSMEIRQLNRWNVAHSKGAPTINVDTDPRHKPSGNLSRHLPLHIPVQERHHHRFCHTTRLVQIITDVTLQIKSREIAYDVERRGSEDCGDDCGRMIMSHLAAGTRVSAQTGFTRLKLVCAYKMVCLPRF